MGCFWTVHAVLAHELLVSLGVAQKRCDDDGSSGLALRADRAYTADAIDAVASPETLAYWRAVIAQADFHQPTTNASHHHHPVSSSPSPSPSQPPPSAVFLNDGTVPVAAISSLMDPPRARPALAACKLDSTSAAWFAAGTVFARRFLAAANPHLGRSGSVCPFVPKVRVEIHYLPPGKIHIFPRVMVIVLGF
jgi:hypothetical protein